MASNMPAAEVEITAGLVRSLLASQRPQLSDSEVTLLANGWDNVSFRVGEELVARLPRRSIAASLIANEARWLPDLASGLSLAVPVPLFVGAPTDNYPWIWSLVPFIPGKPVDTTNDLDLSRAAEALGQFLRELHSPAPPDAPENPYRGIALAARDQPTRERLRQLDSTIDAPALLRVWDAAVEVPTFGDEPVWLHGDLHPHNLLASAGHLTGVIDFGDITSGDPATDLAVGWMLFPADVRAAFRVAHGRADDETWQRARGWALSLATAYLAHSADNPGMNLIGTTTLDRLARDA